MLRHRLPIGAGLIMGILGAVWVDEWASRALGVNGVTLWPLLAIVGVLASRELSAIFRKREIDVSPGMVLVAGSAGFLTSSLTPADVAGMSGIAVACTVGAAVLVGSMAYASRGRDPSGVTAAAGATLLAFVYLGLMGGFLMVLRREHTAWLVLAIVLVTKSCDIGAYFVGRFFGRTKLIHWLSPKKTWEGLWGGLAFSTAVGTLAVLAADALGATLVTGVSLAWWHGAVAGLIFGAVGQGGDLVASLLKRDAGIKDASRTIPGFGGVLDVIDSPIMVAPVAYWATLAVAGLPGG
jgi:phosphatidate cytidylyltransferase